MTKEQSIAIFQNIYTKDKMNGVNRFTIKQVKEMKRNIEGYLTNIDEEKLARVVGLMEKYDNTIFYNSTSYGSGYIESLPISAKSGYRYTIRTGFSPNHRDSSFFHEYGHLIDYLFDTRSEYQSFSANMPLDEFDGRTFEQVILEDYQEHVSEVKEVILDQYRLFFFQESKLDILNNYQENADLILSIRSLIRKRGRDSRLNSEKTKQMVNAEKELENEILLGTEANAFFSKNDLQKISYKGFHPNSVLMDFINYSSKNPLFYWGFSYGHSNTYLHKNSHFAQEIFAELCSYYMTDESQIELIRKYLPKTVDAFFALGKVVYDKIC